MHQRKCVRLITENEIKIHQIGYISLVLRFLCVYLCVIAVASSNYNLSAAPLVACRPADSALPHIPTDAKLTNACVNILGAAATQHRTDRKPNYCTTAEKWPLALAHTLKWTNETRTKQRHPNTFYYESSSSEPILWPDCLCKVKNSIADKKWHK